MSHGGARFTDPGPRVETLLSGAMRYGRKDRKFDGVAVDISDRPSLCMDARGDCVAGAREGAAPFGEDAARD